MSKKEILIVEDSPVQAELLRRLLTGEGYVVSIAGNGHEGLAVIKEKTPDLIISDISMPEMDGYDMCRRIKEERLYKNIPVILLTQLSDTQDLIKGLNAKADIYITKPFNDRHLISKIREVISRDNKKPVIVNGDSIELTVLNKSFPITSDLGEIINFLVSTYENAIEQNRELIKTRDELRMLNEHLEENVEKRTIELKESEERLELLMQTVPDIIYRIDGDGKFLYINNAITGLGYKPEELIGKHFSCLIDTSGAKDIERSEALKTYEGKVTGDKDAPKLFDERRTGDRATKNLEVNLLPKSVNGGREIPDTGMLVAEINSSGMYEIDPDTRNKSFVGSFGVIKSKEHFIGTTGVIRDITDRKKAEEIIHDSEKRFRSVVETANDAIITIDGKGEIVSWNSAAVKIFGYSYEEVLGRELTLIVPDRFKEGHRKGIRRVLYDNNSKITGKTLELSAIRKDGHEFPIELSLASWKTKDDFFFTGVIRDITKLKKADRELKETLEKLRRSMGGIIHTIAMTVEARDPYTAGHQRRVSDLARAIADKMSLSKDRIDGIRVSASIHDIGRISVPSEILSKPGIVNTYEYELIKLHPQTGYEILKNIDFPWPVADVVLRHHEKFDGSGYPGGLKGEEIPLEARIICVADVVEAMSFHRPYRPALGMDKALKEIESKKGVLYDPAIAEICLDLLKNGEFEFSD